MIDDRRTNPSAGKVDALGAATQVPSFGEAKAYRSSYKR
jgi:hypothetical protein